MSAIPEQEIIVLDEEFSGSKKQTKFKKKLFSDMIHRMDDDVTFTAAWNEIGRIHPRLCSFFRWMSDGFFRNDE